MEGPGSAFHLLLGTAAKSSSSVVGGTAGKVWYGTFSGSGRLDVELRSGGQFGRVGWGGVIDCIIAAESGVEKGRELVTTGEGPVCK